MFCFFLFSSVGAQDEGYRIEVEIAGYDQPILTLANNVLDSQYIVDTAEVDGAGKYVFASDSNSLPGGIYLVVTAPDNNYFQILVDDDNQNFSITTTLDDLNAVTISGSEDNSAFASYMSLIQTQGKRGEPIREQLADSTITEDQRGELTRQLKTLEEEVTAYQNDLIEQSPNSFTALIIEANRPLPPPKFSELETEEKRREAQFRWLQNHYFDQLDLNDDRLLRTPFLIQRIEYFTDKLHVQHPDSISYAIDKILGKMDPNGDLFKYYLVHYINKAATSKVVGHDAIYVHLVENYYAKNKAYWADEEQLTTMKENADKIRPLLIGKQAPDITMKRRDGTLISLYGVDAKYTILYFWAFDCGHCKKSTPHMKEFYAEWKDKGAEIFSICTKQNKLEKCWEYVDEQEIGDWMHVTDRYMRFYKDYDITSTPTIFVLDENKKIISKRIGAQQLDELLTRFEEQSALEEKSGK